MISLMVLPSLELTTPRLQKKGVDFWANNIYFFKKKRKKERKKFGVLLIGHSINMIRNENVPTKIPFKLWS